MLNCCIGTDEGVLIKPKGVPGGVHDNDIGYSLLDQGSHVLSVEDWI